MVIHHICINSLVPSVLKINIGNPGNQVNYWGGGGGGGGGGGLNHPINFAGYLDFQYWFFCIPGNQQINANMVISILHKISDKI